MSRSAIAGDVNRAAIGKTMTAMAATLSASSFDLLNCRIPVG